MHTGVTEETWTLRQVIEALTGEEHPLLAAERAKQETAGARPRSKASAAALRAGEERERARLERLGLAQQAPAPNTA